MLAGRVLPPIVRTSPLSPQTPVATFFHVPRRYVKSNMQVGDDSPESPMDDAKLSQNLRKSSRIHETRSAPTSNPTAERTKKEELPAFPASSSPRATRKRLASLVEVAEREDCDSPTDDRPPPSATSATAGGSPDFSGHVCLCQPEPKIPRPRNAFILYRQHHQQAITARNPGLNNPDISKVIGEQWKAEGEEQKKVWQDLAQEEKARHQEQYPDYRYQPRRVGKPGSSPLNPTSQHTTVDKYRCHKCGGRSLGTPTSPFLDASGTPTLPPPNRSEGLTPTTRYLPVMSNLSIQSPVLRRGPGPSGLSNIQVTSAMHGDSMMYSPLTPNKKRRFDYGPHPPTNNGRRPEGPYYAPTQHAHRRESLPPIHVPPHSATMPPPRTPRDVRQTSIVELGPLQHDGSPRSVEEVLSAFPYPNKVKLLGRITPPYKEPGSASPSYRANRGAIIAIEGDDLAAVKELSEWLNEYLIKQREYKPQIAEPPQAPNDDDKEVTFENYLDLIKEWHGKSKEMIKYITTPSSSTSSPKDTTMSDKDSTVDTSSRKDSATPPDSPSLALLSTIKPVIILPTFQLQASVAYASRIRIQDAYSPTDHWQWMATLWRGTVGPDLTLYVKSFDPKEGQVGHKPEMDDQIRCLTVCKAREGRFADADLRRVGFEVGEWVKG